MRIYSNVYLSLGSNIGDRVEYLVQAVKKIGELSDTYLLSKSNYYETEPVGNEKQENFMNLCIMIKTRLKPYKLLKELNRIEEFLDRKRLIKWGPRTIDIDIILYDNLKIQKKDLIIPHKEFKKRNFVLHPLLEIYTGDLHLKKYLTLADGEIKKL